MVQVKSVVKRQRFVKTLGKAKSKYQVVAKQKNIQQFESQQHNKNVHQIKPALDKKTEIYQSKQQQSKNLSKARQVKEVKTFTKNYLPKAKTVAQLAIDYNQLSQNPSASLRTKMREGVARSLAAQKRQLQSQGKALGQAIEDAKLKRAEARMKTTFANVARAQKTAKNRLSLQNRQSQAQKARTIRGTNQENVISSNVNNVSFDPASNLLYVSFCSGAVYEYDLNSISKAQQLYLNILTGNAVCKTQGVSQYNGRKWWIGKSPSVGAAVWKYLRNTGISYRRVSAVVIQSMGAQPLP